MMRKSPGQAVREVGRSRIVGSLDANIWIFAMATKASRCPREESDRNLFLKTTPNAYVGNGRRVRRETVGLLSGLLPQSPQETAPPEGADRAQAVQGKAFCTVEQHEQKQECTEDVCKFSELERSVHLKKEKKMVSRQKKYRHVPNT